MHTNTKLFAAFSTLLLTMCTFYDPGGAVVSPNGLSCQTRTEFELFERQQSAQCYYRCPDGTVRQPEIAGEFSSASPLYGASREELDSQFCDIALQPAPVQPTAAASSTLTESVTASPTAARSVTASPTEPAAPITELLSPASGPPLLTGQVTMCDTGANLISFRIIQPLPELTDKTLSVQIASQDTTCAINAVNPSLLTCAIQAPVTFPERVVVRLDGVVVNDFTYSGLGCAELSTPAATTTP